jgi:hypothetical protein
MRVKQFLMGNEVLARAARLQARILTAIEMRQACEMQNPLPTIALTLPAL